MVLHGKRLSRGQHASPRAHGGWRLGQERVMSSTTGLAVPSHMAHGLLVASPNQLHSQPRGSSPSLTHKPSSSTPCSVGATLDPSLSSPHTQGHCLESRPLLRVFKVCPAASPLTSRTGSGTWAANLCLSQPLTSAGKPHRGATTVAARETWWKKRSFCSRDGRKCCCSGAQSCPIFCGPPWTAARQASLSITNSRSLLRLVSTE